MAAGRGEAAFPLRVGLLLDAPIQETWVLDAVKQALAVPGVSLGAVAIARSPPARPSRLLDFLTAGQCRKNPTSVPVDVVAALGARAREVGVDRPGHGWSPDDSSVAALRRENVDVWLCFSAFAPRPSAALARLGVWGLEIGRGVAATSPWAAAGEIAGGSVLTMISAVSYTTTEATLLYRSFGATLGDCVCANRRRALRKGIAFFKRLLEGVTRTGAVPARPATLDVPEDYPSSTGPTTDGLLRLSARLARAGALKRMPSAARRQWQVGYYFADEGDGSPRVDRLRYLVPPADRFWADPFAVEHDGRHFVLLEELPYSTQRGRIVAVEVFEDRDPGPPQLALERPYHLSYPFTFRWEGQLYMMPETAANKTIEVYQCEEFPSRWRLHTVMREEVNAFDATLWAEPGRWWMFVNVAEPGADPCDELHVYSGTTPFGPWHPHPRNPVVSDVRCARPAGPVFSSNGIRYRPSQDDSIDYGYAVVINRIAELGDENYAEAPAGRLDPGWRNDILRVHTFGGSGRLRVVDCMVRRSRW